MKDQIEALHRLQVQDRRMVSLEQKLAAIPVRMAEMERDLGKLESMLRTELQRLDESRTFLASLGLHGQFVHTPGHSDDSISVLLDSGEVFTGDLTHATKDPALRRKRMHELHDLAWQLKVPEVRFIRNFADDDAYIAALAASVREHWKRNGQAERLVLSFHGIPKRSLELGDPYHCECHKTARLLGEALQLAPGQLVVSFQSRFGRAKWLEPATDAVLAAEGQRGTRKLAIAAPGFSADCLETREELAIRGREQFAAAGGTHYAALDCLNTSEAGMTMLEALVRRELAGWTG